MNTWKYKHVDNTKVSIIIIRLFFISTLPNVFIHPGGASSLLISKAEKNNFREIMVSGTGFWQTERANRNFLLQRRKVRYHISDQSNTILAVRVEAHAGCLHYWLARGTVYLTLSHRLTDYFIRKKDLIVFL